jgi:hypothetical protein
MQQVDQSHSGEYTCTPFNDLGSSGESAPMKVIVQQPPIFSVRPASLYVRRIGNNVKMHCAAEPETFNNPNPLIVTWFKVKLHRTATNVTITSVFIDNRKTAQRCRKVASFWKVEI